MSETPQQMFSGASPKLTFAFGLVLGVAVFAMIGFFSLLLNGSPSKSSSASASTTTTNTNTTAAVIPDTNADSGAVAEPLANVNIPITDQDHVRGSGDVTLVEFSDFECPFCGRVAPTMDQILKDYNGKVKLVYKHFPLSFHPNAQPAALASECANEQGKFWEFHDKLFANQESLSTDFYKKTAQELGLNGDKFQKCLDGNTYASRVTNDENLGAQVGVQGTPATVLIDKNGNKQMISGAVPYASFKSVIDAAL